MTFLAEWGDRSQLTTIILGAREDPLGVVVGGVLGHALCTGAAVIGGRLVATKISVKTVTIIGGIVFLIFALSALVFNDSGEDVPLEPVPLDPGVWDTPDSEPIKIGLARFDDENVWLSKMVFI